MHGCFVIFSLFEDYEKIEFCVISLDRICIRRGREGGGGGGCSFMLFGGDLGEKLPHIALNMLVLNICPKDQELTNEVLCPRDRIPCTVI